MTRKGSYIFQTDSLKFSPLKLDEEKVTAAYWRMHWPKDAKIKDDWIIDSNISHIEVTLPNIDIWLFNLQKKILLYKALDKSGAQIDTWSFFIVESNLAKR